MVFLILRLRCTADGGAPHSPPLPAATPQSPLVAGGVSLGNICSFRVLTSPSSNMMEETQDNIVEALPASCSTEDTFSHQSPSKLKTQPKQGICNHQTPTSRLTHPDVTSHQSQAKQGICTSQTPSSSRFTRSQAAPDWTVPEVLVLLSEIVAVDDDWFKALSSYQRWKMISDNCIAMDVVRSSNQCKRKWEMLLTDYRKIRKWESRSRGDSYWFLQEEKRKEYGLPGSFQKEVFEAIVAVIEVQQYQYDSNNDPKQIIRVSEIETPNVEVDSASGSREKELTTTPKSPEKLPLGSKEEELITTPKSPEKLPLGSKEDFTVSPKCREKVSVLALALSPETYVQDLCSGAKDEELRTTPKSPMKARVMADEVHRNAEHMCAILRRDLHDVPSQVDLMKPSAMEKEFARRKANELIKAIAGLTSSLNEFIEFINNGECGTIVHMESIKS